jgi:hypothetical protein
MNAQSRISSAAGHGRPLKLNPITGSLPVLQYCAPEQLLIDETYQRSLENEGSVTLIRKIAASWDWGLCQPLFVARRSDGGMYVVDGQHRLAAAVMRGDIPQLPCVVSHFDTPEAEAGAFVALNQQRRPLNALELFKAALVAGEPEAIEIRRCLDMAGLRLANTTNNQGMKAGQVGNIGGLQRCYRLYGEIVLATSLKVLSHAYPQQVLRYAGSIFPGIVAVVAGELANRAQPDELLERLSAFVGSQAQHEWYRSFARALGDDHLLKRSQASETVLRRQWVECRQAQIGQERIEAGLAPTAMRPTEKAWCEQCDQRRSGAQAASCASPFCKLKAKAA